MKVKLNGTKYDFTVNWFDPSQPQWKNLIAVESFPNRPVNILEIGSFEGRSTVWMLESLCTHPESRLAAIDTFGGSIETELEVDSVPVDVANAERRFLYNVKASGEEHKVQVLKGRSSDRLMELNLKLREGPASMFDFVYIDASHNADDVLGDAVLVWPLLKENGIIIFDDYDLNRFEEKYNNPRIGVDAFVECFQASIEILTKNYQMTIRKVNKKRSFTLRNDYVQNYDATTGLGQK